MNNMTTNKKLYTGFILILFLMSLIVFMNRTVPEPAVETATAIHNIDPVESVEIQGENVVLTNVEGYMIEEWNMAGGGTQYVLRLRGVAHEFGFTTSSEAQDIGDYICMLKGERL